MPAWAEASIAPAEVPADTPDQQLTLTATEPGEENEAYGDTARVVVRPPSGFTITNCGSTIGWSCARAEDGSSVTFTRTLALGATHELEFTVHTSPFNGKYAFRVTQADGPPAAEGEEPPATVTDQAVVTVTGGEDPPSPPAPGPSPTPGASSGTGGGGSSDDGATADGDETNDGAGDEEAPAAGDDQDAAGDTSTGDTGSTGGSTAPRRTQGRASGATLEITPGEPAGDDPAIAPPAVADDPAVAPPSGTDGTNGVDRDTSDSTAAAAAGARPSDQPGRGAPWQQWVGGAMLLAGLATVGVRWLRQRRAR